MKSRLVPALLLAFAFAMTQGLSAADKAKSPGQCKCPVSGRQAKAAQSAEYLGKEVYFCCGNCKKAFTANPKKFAAAANHQLAATGQIVQVACPFSGKPVKNGTEVNVAGVTVKFCCNHCQAKAKKATGKQQIALVFAKLDKGFTTQTKCPVSGKDIDPKKSVEYKGEKVYFCCGHCQKAFEKNPSKFAAKLK